MQQQRGFTLIEVLVVISIITLLLSIAQPSMRSARESARDVECRSQFHQIGLAFIALSDDNRDRLPGLWGPPWTGPQPLQGSFIGKEVFKPFYQPPPAANRGTLAPYLGGDESARQMYRCPALPLGVFRSGTGSNGMFDVTMIQSIPGAALPKLPQTATYIEPGSGRIVTTPFPVIIEEDPAFGINSTHVDMGHTTINRFASTHFGSGGNYVTADGSAHHLTFPQRPGPDAWSWMAQSRSGLVNLGDARDYGKWD